MGKLTQKEQLFFDVMKTQGATLYLEGKSGIGKTALMYSIADKMGYHLEDLRLSSMDETDLGRYPLINKMDEDVHVMSFAIPDWAYQANTRPTILFFDELNRAPLTNRNAALQILNERQIGPFKFNDGVLMCSAGNAGEEDGNDVEEFDAALWGRIAYVKYDLSVDEWRRDFGNENVWEVICNYLSANVGEAYKRSENSKSYQTYRSWTNLSNHLKHVFGGLDKIKLAQARSVLNKIGSWYIGNGIVKFLRYLENMEAINVDDILNNFEEIKETIQSFNRARQHEMTHALSQINVNKLTKTQLNNLIKFVGTLESDGIGSYLLHVSDESEQVVPSDAEKKIYNAFPTEYKLIKDSYSAKGAV